MKNELKTDFKYSGLYADWVKRMNSSYNSFFATESEAALGKLEKISFPTTKDEDWRFTNVSPILKAGFLPATKNDSSEKTLKGKIKTGFYSGLEAHKVVFVNGFFNEQFSDIKKLPENVFIGSLKKASEEIPEIVKKYYGKTLVNQNAFELLNESFASDGLFIYIPKNVILELPVEVVFVADNAGGKMISPRNLIVAEENSEVNIFTDYSSSVAETYFTNSITEIFGDKNAHITFLEVQAENNDSYRIGTTKMQLKDSASLNHFVLTQSGKLVRNNLNAELDGENIEAHFYGFYIVKEKRHIDNHTFIDHAKPNCFSNEIYKGILEDEAKAVFGGRILVRKDSQKTNAFQSNKTILLSDKARIDTKPQLEIYADDVKCTHGATVGQLDKEALFYIISRGISPEAARSMLIKAFANDFLEPIKLDVVKENINNRIFNTIEE